MNCKTIALLLVYFHRLSQSLAFVRELSQRPSQRIEKWKLPRKNVAFPVGTQILGAQTTGYISPEDSEKTRIQLAKKRLYPAVGDVDEYLSSKRTLEEREVDGLSK
jgi:hypothetical protein